MTDAAQKSAADFSWNPMVPIAGPEHATALAKSAALSAGLLALNYALTLGAALAMGGVKALPPLLLGVCVAAVAAAGGLAAVIRRSAPLWAVLAVLAWTALETLGALWGLRSGFAGRSLSVIADLLALLFAVQAARGGLYLRQPA